MSKTEGTGSGLSGRLGYLLKHAQLRMAELNAKALGPHGISGRELAVLLVLAGQEPVSQYQASQWLGIDRTTMVAQLDALEGKGLVSRHPDAADRRRNMIELTDVGHDTLQKAVKASDEAERELLAPLGPQAARDLRNALQAIAAPAAGAKH